jgi:GAF domain-containing protein
MKTVLLVTADPKLRARLLRPLGERSVFFADTDDDAVRTLRCAEVDLVIKDAPGAAPEMASFAARVRELSPRAVIVGISDDAAIGDSADYALVRPFGHRDLAAVLRQAEERHGLVQELDALRTAGPAELAIPIDTERRTEPSPTNLEQALRHFARVIAVGFDLPRMLELFLEAIGEMAQPCRSALLLTDAPGRLYSVWAQRGLSPQIVEAVRLPVESGLPHWLETQGRPITLDEALQRSVNPRTRALARELALLQSVLAIPLLARGDLVAILALGERVAGGGYDRRDIELLFALATQAGAAIRHIRMHHQLQQEHERSQQIIVDLSSGVITIGADEKVASINPRAEQILQLASCDVLYHDLRILPSPLGDLLFETLSRRRAVERTEVQLALRKQVLEVTTFPLLTAGARPLGAALVFDDLSARRAIAEERRQEDHFRLLTQVGARLSDEVRRPLVTLASLVQGLDEPADPRSRQQLASALRDVQKALSRLGGWAEELEPSFEAVDVRGMVDDLLRSMGAKAASREGTGATLLELRDEQSGKQVLLSLYYESTPQLVKADRRQLKQAVEDLLWYLVHNSAREQAKLSISVGHGKEEVQLLLTSRSATLSPEQAARLFDLAAMAEESLIAMGPALSRRRIDAQGGRVQVRQGRHELSFLITLAAMTE